MVFKSPSEVLFNIGTTPIYCYGVVLAIACLVGILVSYNIYKKYYPESNYAKILDFSSITLIAGILGARLYYCILNHSYFFNHPLEIFNIRGGGLSIHGSIIAGVIVLIFFARKYELGIFKILDSFSCGTILGQSIGRWGNFFNSEAFGTPTDLPWKLYIPVEKRPIEYINFDYFHPTFLYESILDLLIFILLCIIINKYAKKKSGVTFCSYLILYSLVRIFIEILRVDSAANIFGLPIALVVSIIVLIIGIFGLKFLLKEA